MKKVLITGASGFVGKNLLLHKPDNWFVKAVCHMNDLEVFIKSNKIKTVVSNHVNLSREDEFKTISGDYDIVIWLAANSDPALSVVNPLLDLINNTYSLVNALKHIRTDVLIYFSSGAVYDGLEGEVNPEVKLNPHLPYAVSKLACEQYVKYFASKGSINNYQIVRFFGAYGPYEPPRKIFSRLVRTFGINKENRFKVRGDGRNYIDAMFVEDAVEGILLLSEKGDKNKVLDFFMGGRISINELAEKVAEIFGVAGAVIEHEGEVPEYIKFAPSLDYMRGLGWRPKFSLRDGIYKLRNHLLDHDCPVAKHPEVMEYQ